MTGLATVDATCRRLRPALGTFVSVLARAGDQAKADRAVEQAFESFEVVHRLMHPARGADLAAIRTAPVGRPISVSLWTWQLLGLCAQVNEISEGRFDPCLPEGGGAMSDIDLPDPEVVVLRRRVAIDLGGVAKGFAVDRAIDCLRAAGCSAGEVNAGGDLRVFGPSGVRIWLRTGRTAEPVTVRDQACAMTDPTSHDRPVEHRGYYSRTTTSVPIHFETPVAVLAPTAAIADALTKCVLLCEREPTLLQRILTSFDAVSIAIRY